MTARHCARSAKQALALFFIFILIVQPVVVAQDSADDEREEEEEAEEEELTPEVFREIPDPNPDDLGRCPTCTITEFDLLDTSERASFLLSDYNEEYADHFFSDAEHVGVNEQVERSYFSRDGNVEESVESAERFLQLRYDRRYAISTGPVPTGLRYNAQDDTFSSGPARLSLDQLAQPARVIRIIAVQGGFRFVTRDEDAEEGEEETVDFVSETDSTITFDEENGLFEASGADEEVQAQFTTGDADSRITIDNEGTMTVHGDARGFYRTGGEMVEFQNRQGALRIWSDGRIRADDAEINTRTMYLDGRFYREGDNVVSYSFNREGQAGMAHSVVVDKATAVGSVSQGQVRREGCERIPTIEPSGGCGGVVTHLQQRYERSAYGNAERTDTGTGDDAQTPQPPISAQEARERARQLRMERPDIGENGEVWIAGTRGGEVSVYARGRVGVQSFAIQGGNVQHIDMGRPRFTGYDGRSVFDYSATGDRDRFQVMGQGEYDDRQIHLDAEQDGTFVQRLMNYDDRTETYEVDCDDCEDGERAATLMKRLMIVRERNVRIRGTREREEIAIGERYDEDVLTERLQWQGGMRLEYVQRGDALRTVVPTANLQQIASYTRAEGATIAFDRDFFVRTGSGEEWFGISASGIGSYESTAAGDGFSPRSVTTDLTVRSTIGDIVVPTSEAELEGVRQFLSALGAREWTQEERYGHGYAQLRNVGGITDERVIAALTQETGIDLDYLQRDDAVGEEYTDRIVRALRFAAAGRTRATFSETPESINDLRGNAQHYQRQQQAMQGQIAFLQAQRLIAEQEGQDTTQIDRSIRRLRGRASQLEHAREAVEQQVEGMEAAQQRADEQRRAATAYGDDISETDQRRLLEADQIRQQQEEARRRISSLTEQIRQVAERDLEGEGAAWYESTSGYIEEHAPDARRRIAELQREMGQLSEQIRLSDQRLAALGHESDSQVMRVRVLMAGGRHDLAGEAMAEQTVVIDPATGRITGGAPIIDDPQTQTALQMMSRMDQGDTRGIRYDLESGRVYTSQRVAFLRTAEGGTETVAAMDFGDLTPEQQGRLQTWGEQVSEEYVSDPAIVQMLSARLREETERHLVEDYNRATRTDVEVRRRVGDARSEREGVFYNYGHWVPCLVGMCWGEVDDAYEGAAGRATRDRRVASATVLTLFRHGRCGEDGSRQCSMSDIRAMDASEARRQLAEITRRAQASEEEVRIVGGLEHIGTASAESQERFDEQFGNRFISARHTAGFHMAEQAESGFFISDSRVREMQAQALLDEADQISSIHHSPGDQRHVYEQIAREYGDTQAAIAAREQIGQIREDETLNFAGINTGWEWGIDSRTAGVFATEMLGDPTNFIPVGLVARGAAHGVQLTTAALRTTEYAVQVSRAARVAAELNQARRALQAAERTVQAARAAEHAVDVERATARVTELNAHIAQLEQQAARFTTAQRVGRTVLRTTRVPGEAMRAILRPADAYEWLGSANARSRVLYGSALRREMTALARTAVASERAAVETERSALAAERIAEAARRAPAIGPRPYRSAVTGAQEATLRAQELRRAADVARRTAWLDEEALTLQRRIVEAERIAGRYQGVAGAVRRAWGASERAWSWGFRERQASAAARAEFMAAADAFNMFRSAPGTELAGLADDVIQAERAYEQALHAHQVVDPVHRAIEWTFAPDRLGAPEDFLLRNAQRLERRRAVRHILFGAVDRAGLSDDASRQILDTLGTRLDNLEEMASGLPTNLDIRVLSDGRVSYNEDVFRALQGSDPELAEGVRGVVDELNELIGNSGLADEAAVMAARRDAPVTTQSVAAAVTDDIADAVRELPPEANPRISCQGAVAGYRCTVEVDTAWLAPEGTAQRQAEDLALLRANEGLRELEGVGGEPFVQSVREGIVSSSREDEIIEEAAQIATTADAGEEVMDALRAGEIGSDRPVSRLLGEQLPISDRPPLSGQVAWNDDAGAIARAVQHEIQDGLARGDADRLAALRNLLDDERIVARFRGTGADDVLQHLRVRADEAIGGRTSISSSMGEEIGDLSVTSRRTTTSSQPISRQFVSDEELARIRASVQQEMPPGTLPEQIDLEIDTIVRRMEREDVSEFQPPRIEPEARRVEPEAPPARVEPELAPEPTPEVVAPAPRPRPAPEAPVDELLAARQRLDEIDDDINRLEEIVRHEDTPVAQRISAQRELEELSSARIEQERIVRGFEMGPAPAPEPALAPGARPEPIPAPAPRPREAVLVDLERADSNIAVAQREAEIAQRESAAAERGLAEAAGAPQKELRAIEQRAGSARLRQEQAEQSLAAAEQEFTRTVSQAPDDVVQEFRAARKAEEGVAAAPAETLPTRASQRADELEGVADGARQELTTIDDNLDVAVRQKIDATQRLQERIARGERIGPDDEDLQALSRAIEDENRLAEARAAMRQGVAQLEESRVMAEQQDVVAITRRLRARDPDIPRRMHEDYQEFLGTLSREDRARARRTICRIASPITCDDGDLGDDLERVFRPAEEVGIPSTFTPDEMDAVVSHAGDLPEYRPPSDLARAITVADTQIRATVGEEQRRMLSLAFDDTVLREEGQLLPEARMREGLPRVPASLPDGRFRPVEISAQNFPDLDERLLGWMEENRYTHIVGRQERTPKTAATGDALDLLGETESRELGLNQLLFLRREDGTEVVWRLDSSHPDIYDASVKEGLNVFRDTGTRQIASQIYEEVGERLIQTSGVRRRALAGRRVELPGGHTVIETPAMDFVDLGKSRYNPEELVGVSIWTIASNYGLSDDMINDLQSAFRAGERRLAEVRMEPLLSRLERPAQHIIDKFGLTGDRARAMRRIDDLADQRVVQSSYVIGALPPHLRDDPGFVWIMHRAMDEQATARVIRRQFTFDTQLNLERFAREHGLSRADVARVDRALREDEAVAAALGMSDSGVGIRIADDGAIELVRFDEEFFGSGIRLPFRGQEGIAPYPRPYESHIVSSPMDLFLGGATNFIFGYTASDEIADVAQIIARERGLERIVSDEEALRLYFDELHRPVIDAIDDVFNGPRREETLDLISSAVHPQSGVDADAYAQAFRNGVLGNVKPRTLEDTIRQMVQNDGVLVVSPEVASVGPDGLSLRRAYHTQNEVLAFYAKSPEERLAETRRMMERPAPEEIVPPQAVPQEALARLDLSPQQREIVERAMGTTEMTPPPANLDDQIRQFERIEVSASRPSRFEPLEVSADDLEREVVARRAALRLSDAPVDIEIVRQPTISRDGQFVIRQDSRPVVYGRIARRGESAARDNTLGALRDMAQLQAHGGQHAPRPLFIAYFDDAQGTPHLLTIQSAAPGETAEDILRRVVTSSGTEREAAMQRAREAMRDIGAALGDSHSRSLQEVSDDALDLLDEDINFMTQAMDETELTQRARIRGDILRTAQRHQVTTHTDFRLPNVLHSEEAGGIIIDFEKARIAGHPSDDLATFMEDIVTASRTDRLGGEFTQTEIDELLAEFLAGYRRNSPVGMDEIEEGLGFYRARRVFRAPDPNIEQRLAHILSDEGANDVRRIIDRSYEIEREVAMAEEIPTWRPPPPAAPHVVALRDEMRNAGRMDDASLAQLDDVLDDIEPQIRGNTIITCPGCAVTYTGDNPEGVQIARTLRDTIHRIEADDPAALRMPSTGTADDLAEALAIEEAAREQGIAVRRTIAVGNDARDAARQPSRIGDSVLAEARVERDSIIIERPLVEAPAAPAVRAEPPARTPDAWQEALSSQTRNIRGYDVRVHATRHGSPASPGSEIRFVILHEGEDVGRGNFLHQPRWYGDDTVYLGLIEVDEAHRGFGGPGSAMIEALSQTWQRMGVQRIILRAERTGLTLWPRQGARWLSRSELERWPAFHQPSAGLFWDETAEAGRYAERSIQDDFVRWTEQNPEAFRQHAQQRGLPSDADGFLSAVGNKPGEYPRQFLQYLGRDEAVPYSFDLNQGVSPFAQRTQAAPPLAAPAEEVAVRREIAAVPEREMPRPEFKGDIGDVVEVSQREFAITHADDENPVLATSCLTACVAFVGYDTEHGVGFLTHYDAYTDLRRALEELEAQARLTGGQFDVRIVGGRTEQSEDMIDFLRQYTADPANSMRLVEEDVLGEITRSIALDTRTGEIFYYDPLKNPRGRRLTSEQIDWLMDPQNSEPRLVHGLRREEGEPLEAAIERGLAAPEQEIPITVAEPERARTAEEYAQPIIDPTDIAPRDVRTAQNPLEKDPSFGSSYQPSVGQAIERVLQSPGITTSDAVAVINHPQDYVLSFRHGTSSAALGGIASEGRLMTYGDLHASGRVPFSGELNFGIRPGDINWEYISGVPFDAGGIDIRTYARGMTRGWTPQIGEQQLEATAQGLEFALQAKADGVRQVGYMAIDDVIAVSRERLSIAQQRIDTWSRLNPFEQQMISDPFPIVISAEVPDLTSPAIVAAQRGGVPIQGIATERLARGSIDLDETPFVVFVPRERMHQVQQYLEMRMGRPVRVQSIESLEAFDEITAAFSPEGRGQVAMGNRHKFRQNPEWLARFREDGASYLRGEPPRPVRERMAAEATEREALEEELAALTPQGVQDELLSAHDEILRAQRQLGRAQEDAVAARDRLRRWSETPEGKQQMRQELPAPVRNLFDAENRVDAAQAELHTARDTLGRARERAARVGLDADMELALVDTRRERRIADLENRLRHARQERDMLREAARRAPSGVDVRGRLPLGFEVSPELRAFLEADSTVASVERQLQTEQDLLQASQARKAGLQAQRAARAPDPQEAQGLLGRLLDKVRGVCRIGSYECDVDVLPDADLDDVGRALGRTDVTADNLDVVVAAELGEALGPTPPTGSLEEISEALETASEISRVGPLPTTNPGPSAMITALLERELPGTSELAGLADAEASQIWGAFAARYQEGVIQLSEEELIDITNIPNRFAQPYDTYLRTTHPGAPTARITGVIDAESGAYGVVMRGRIPNIDEDVALKMPRDARADGTLVYDTAEDAIRAAEQELVAGERLHGWMITHEGIEYPMGPRMHGLVDCGGNPCLAMEEIRGVAVKPLYQQERWDEVAEVLTDDVIDQAYRGVRQAWQEGYASDDWQFIVTPEGRVVFIDVERIVPRTGRITLKSPEGYRDFLRSVQRRAREAREERRIAGLPGAERVAEQQRLADIEFTSQEVVFRLNRLESARETGRGVEEAQAEAREALERLRGLSREEGLELSPRLTPDEEDLVRTWADRLPAGRDEPAPEILQEVGEDTGLARDAIAQDSEIVLIIDEERHAQET